MGIKRKKNLEKEIIEIMQRYHFDPYGKQRYIENCSKAIVKVVLEMIPAEYPSRVFGKDMMDSLLEGAYIGHNELIKEIKQKIKGK